MGTVYQSRKAILNKETAEQMIERLADGETIEQLAHCYGMSVKRAKQLVADYRKEIGEKISGHLSFVISSLGEPSGMTFYFGDNTKYTYSWTNGDGSAKATVEVEISAQSSNC